MVTYDSRKDPGAITYDWLKERAEKDEPLLDIEKKRIKEYLERVRRNKEKRKETRKGRNQYRKIQMLAKRLLKEAQTC